jgi:hypothetical protein
MGQHYTVKRSQWLDEATTLQLPGLVAARQIWIQTLPALRLALNLTDARPWITMTRTKQIAQWQGLPNAELWRMIAVCRER